MSGRRAEPTGLPAEVQARPTAGGVRYLLPARQLGVIRRLAWPVALISGAFLFIPVLVVVAMALSAYFTGGTYWSLIGAGAFALVCLIAASPIHALSMAAAIGRTEIDVSPARIKRIERAGVMRWSKTIDIDTIETLAMRTGGAEVGGLGATSGPLADLGGIVALCAPDGSKRPVAVGYPGALLVPLAQAIGERIDRPVRIERNAVLNPDEDDLRERALHEAAHDGMPELLEPGVVAYTPTDPPARSMAQVSRATGEISIQLDALGVRGTKGIFSFAVIWNAIVLAITGFLIYGLITGGAGLGAVGFGALILSVFLLVGVFVMYTAVRMSTRRAILDVVGDGLLITQKTAFGEDQITWRADQIRSIRVGPSGTKINDEPVLELQIRVKTAGGTTDKHGFLPERSNEVLGWIADELRAALGVPEHIGGPVPRVNP